MGKEREPARPTPLEVKPLRDHRVWIRYSDGVEGEVDLGHLAGRGVFELWNDPAQFDAVHVGDGHAISWTDQVELCPDAVYLQLTGKSPEELFPGLDGL